VREERGGDEGECGHLALDGAVLVGAHGLHKYAEG
jgi:hypothetical protein